MSLDTAQVGDTAWLFSSGRFASARQQVTITRVRPSVVEVVVDGTTRSFRKTTGREVRQATGIQPGARLLSQAQVDRADQMRDAMRRLRQHRVQVIPGHAGWTNEQVIALADFVDTLRGAP